MCEAAHLRPLCPRSPPHRLLISLLTTTISTPKRQALIRNSVVEKNGDQNAAGKVALLCNRDLSVHALRTILRNKKKSELSVKATAIEFAKRLKKMLSSRNRGRPGSQPRRFFESSLYPHV